ncbi:MAG: TetR-like C-terminal domain-containing protein [Dietzia sp.]|nr:TetR-like C-terminal domain-containing protein [Dietzia sp.]
MEQSVSDLDVSTRAKALDAALAELQLWGVDRFSLEGVAHRSHLSPDYVHQTWTSERELIIEALRNYTAMMFALPDTGSLHGDLTELALTFGEYLNEPVARRIARMFVVDSKSLVVDSDTRMQFWELRQKMIEEILMRAAARGEVRSDVKPVFAMHLLTSPLNAVALYTEQPLEPGFCRVIADMVARAISNA